MARISALERFKQKYQVNEKTGCWVWIAYLQNNGYGQFRFNGKMRLAHRFAYQSLIGPIPEGLTLDHLCKNKKCVNPEHLEPVTGYTNFIRGKGHSNLYCPHGHPMFGEYLFFDRKRRYCPECKRIRASNFRCRKKEKRREQNA